MTGALKAILSTSSARSRSWLTITGVDGRHEAGDDVRQQCGAAAGAGVAAHIHGVAVHEAGQRARAAGRACTAPLREVG